MEDVAPPSRKQRDSRHVRNFMDDILSKARYIAVSKFPYLSSLIYGIVPIKTKEISTAGISKRLVMYYNPEFMEELPVTGQATVILHEVLHAFLIHHERSIENNIIDHKRWNVAADMEINDDLCQTGIVMGKFLEEIIVTPQKYKLMPNKTAEFYYKNMPEGVTDSLGKDCGCGSGSGNSPLPGENNEDVVGRTQADIDRMKKEVAGEIKEYVKQRGFVPSEWVRIAEQLTLDPKVNWRELLTSYIKDSLVRQRGRYDYSYSKINTRRNSFDIIFPSMISPVPKIGFLVDTSGSMNDTELGAAVAYIRDILSQLGVGEYYLAIVDAALHSLKRICSAEEVAASLVGGGGSILTPAFEALEKLGVGTIVAVTDLEASIPELMSCDVVWVKCGNCNIEPPYGRIVQVELD